jgi:Carboxypeptidase regulatory-like domain
MKLTFLRFGVGVILAALWVASLPAQVAGRGSLSGLVTDSSGAAVSAASVTLTNVATGVALKRKTSGSGLYSFVSLIPGSYRLEVTQSGFSTAVQNEVSISVDQSEAVNVTLKPGAETETVTVSAAQDIMDVTSSTTAQLIGKDMIERIPLVERDVFQLALLSPGVIPQDGNVTSIDSGRDQVSVFTINGAQQGTIYYILDGSPLTIGENNQGVVIPALEPPLDSVEEFRMEINTTPASVQTGAAGVISLVSKSGTDQFHGDGFVWLRPDGLDANNYFNNLNNVPLPDFHRYQWGGSLGGPIKKNKFFFFADYEGTQQATGAQLTTTVPTAAEKNGDFSGDPGVTLYNPFNFGTNCPSGAPSPCPQPVPNNKIAVINPVAQKYLPYWPSPTTAGVGQYHSNNFFAAGAQPETDQRFDVRLDDNITAAQHLFGRISIHREQSNSPNFFHNDFYGATDSFDHDGNLLIGYDWTMSSNTVLQFRGSATRHYENSQPQGQLGFDMTTLGFAPSLAASSVLPAIPYVSFNGIGECPEAGGGGVCGLGTLPFAIFKFAVTNYDFSATMNKVVGRHELSFGWDFQKQYMNVGQTLTPDGFYQFAPDATSNNGVAGGGAGNGDAFASFLMGVGTLTQGQPNWTTDIFGANSNPYNALFIQDNWHPTPTLTINAGLRWDAFPGATERFNRMEYFDSTLGYNVNGVNLTGGEVFSAPSHRSPYLTNWRDFAPRFGLTYRVLKNAVVRGGFGISYGPSVHMSSINQFNDDSFLAETTWAASAPDPSDTYLVPGNTLSNPFPSGIVEPTNGSLGAATNVGLGLNFVPRKAPDMTTYNFNFGVQYQFPHEAVLSVAWVGSRGLRLTYSNNTPDLNQLSIQTLQQNQNTLLNMVPFPYTNAITNPNAPWYGATQVPQWVMLQSYPQFSYGVGNQGGGGVLDWGDTLGDSIYHSMQAKFEKRISHGFTTLASFTWGKLITNDDSGSLAFNGNNLAVPQDFKNLNLERALSTQDIPFFFSWELSYDLPIGAKRAVNLQGWADRAFGGWTIGTVTEIGDGQPIATPTGTLNPWFNQRPNLAGNCGKGAPKNINQWFNYTCLAEPTNLFAPGTAGAILPGIRGAGARNLDISLEKHFKFGEQRDLQIRAAAYNVTNSVQFGYPNVFWAPENFGQQPNQGDQAGFGQITNQANVPRQMSFEARFAF